jgi:hypothetical protein
MKMTIMPSLLLFLALAPAAQAQDPMEQPPGPAPEIGTSDMDQPPPVDRWLDRLKVKNPEEYARLQKLRKEAPSEFRRVLHEHLQQELMKAGMREFRHGKQPPMNPEIRKIEEETGQMSRAYRETTDLEKQKQIRVELRMKIQALFDLRETERLEHIQRIEADLANLKATLDQRRKNRDRIIEHRLKELTDGDGLRW